MDDNDADKPKGLDFSNIEGLSAYDQGKSDREASEIVDRMTGSRSATQQAMRDIGGVGAFAEAARAASSLNFIPKYMDAIRRTSVFADQVTAHQDAMSVLSLPDTKEQLSAITSAAGVKDQFRAEQSAVAEAQKRALGGLPEGFKDHLMGAQTAASRLMDEIRENHRLMFQHVDMFADMRRSIEAATSFELNSVLNIPRMDSFYDTLRIDHIGSALAAADAASVLGFHSTFNDDVRSVTSLINEQVSALNVAQEAASSALGLGIPERLEEMLARSIAAQEALVDEYREAAKDAKVEAAFHRRYATISMIINVLMLLMALALQIEERMTDEDEAVRANTDAVRELQQSFDGMATQMRRMNDIQESASAEEQAADAAIANLLREIADSLSDQEETEGPEAAEHSPDTADAGAEPPPKAE